MYSLSDWNWRPSNFSTIKALSWNTLFRSIGGGFLGVFIPIYIFLVGGGTESLAQGLVSSGIFIVLMRLVTIGVSIPVARLIRRLGFRRSVVIGTSLEALTYILLIFSRNWPELLWLAAIALGVAVTFFWMPYLSLISGDSQADRMGRSLGIIELVGRGSGVLGPVVGGLIASAFGFEVLFVVGLIVLLISAIPMWFMPYHNHSESPSWSDMFAWLKQQRHRGLIAGFLGRSLDDQIQGWLWPLYVFLFVGSLRVFGGLTSAILFVSMVVVFFASLVFDHYRLSLSRLSLLAGFEAIMRLVRGLATTLPALFTLDSLSRLTSPFFFIGLDGSMFLEAKAETPLVFFAYREIVYSVGRLLMGLLLILVAASTQVWWIMWLAGAGGVIMSLGLAANTHHRIKKSS